MSVILKPDGHTCKACKFREAANKPPPGSPPGECHRYPPRLTAIPVPDAKGNLGFAMHTAFPPVMDEWSCGEHVPRVLNG